MHCNLKNTLLHGHHSLMNKKETNNYSEHTPEKNLIVVLPLKILLSAPNKTYKTVSDSLDVLHKLN